MSPESANNVRLNISNSKTPDRKPACLASKPVVRR
jgi:hypothetical protein